MPRVSGLIEDMSARFNFEQTKLVSLVRVMREAGLITQGARGVNAPPAAAMDAVRMLIAMMLDCKMATVAEDVQFFGNLNLIEMKNKAPFVQPTLEASLLHLVAYFAQADYEALPRAQSVRVHFSPNLGVASIEVRTTKRKMSAYYGPDVNNAPDDVLAEHLEAFGKRFPTKFYQEPELRTEDLIEVAQVVSGHKPLHWSFQAERAAIAGKQTAITAPGASAPGQHEDEA